MPEKIGPNERRVEGVKWVGTDHAPLASYGIEGILPWASALLAPNPQRKNLVIIRVSQRRNVPGWS